VIRLSKAFSLCPKVTTDEDIIITTTTTTIAATENFTDQA
jgi:hypothetical protein